MVTFSGPGSYTAAGSAAGSASPSPNGGDGVNLYPNSSYGFPGGTFGGGGGGGYLGSDPGIFVAFEGAIAGTGGAGGTSYAVSGSVGGVTVINYAHGTPAYNGGTPTGNSGSVTITAT